MHIPLNLRPHHVNTINKEHPQFIIPPHQHSIILRILHVLSVILRPRKPLHQEPWIRLHALALILPEADLIHDGRREERLRLLHLWVGVRVEVLDDLGGCDTQLDGLADGVAGDFSGDEVGEAGAEAGEEGEDGDLEEGICVCVEAVVCFEDNEVFRVGAAANVGLLCGALGEGPGVRSEGYGEAGGVEGVGVFVGAVYDAELSKVFEHLELGRGEGRGGVVLT